jgi:hypothetical protein
MAKAPKTQKNSASVKDFLNSVEDNKKREDAFKVLEMMKEATGLEPQMWGSSIVGFGSYHYKYASGQEGDWPMTGFSPRKTSLTIYIMPGFKDYQQIMKKLGRYKTGSSCLYIKKLEDVDINILKTLISKGFEYMRQKYEVDLV